MRVEEERMKESWMDKDNHIGRVRDNEYDKEQYYDERYDQTEEKKEEIRKVLVEPCRAYDLEDND